MRKLWHSYSVFLSRGYGLGVLVISPIGMLLLFLLLNSVIGGHAVMLARVTFFSYLVIYEVISDYWLFGGICKRDANGLEHLGDGVSQRIHFVKKLMSLILIVFKLLDRSLRHRHTQTAHGND